MKYLENYLEKHLENYLEKYLEKYLEISRKILCCRHPEMAKGRETAKSSAIQNFWPEKEKPL